MSYRKEDVETFRGRYNFYLEKLKSIAKLESCKELLRTHIDTSMSVFFSMRIDNDSFILVIEQSNSYTPPVIKELSIKITQIDRSIDEFDNKFKAMIKRSYE